MKFRAAMEDVAETTALVMAAAMGMIAHAKTITEVDRDTRMTVIEEEMKDAEMIIAEMITDEMTIDAMTIDVTITDVKSLDATMITVVMIIDERPAEADPLELDTKVIGPECKFCN